MSSKPIVIYNRRHDKYQQIWSFKYEIETNNNKLTPTSNIPYDRVFLPSQKKRTGKTLRVTDNAVFDYFLKFVYFVPSTRLYGQFRLL